MDSFRAVLASDAMWRSIMVIPVRREPRVGESEARTPLLTVAEVAQHLRVSTMTVYRLIKAGDLAAIRVGKSYRLREDDVEQYLQERYTETG